MKKYKLIKEYPGSPKLGQIVEYDNNSYSYIPGITDDEFVPRIQILSNNPEYWEEIIKKDYEILSFKGILNTNKGLFILHTNGKYYFKGETDWLEKGIDGILIDPLSTATQYAIDILKYIYDNNITVSSEDLEAIKNGNINDFPVLEDLIKSKLNL